MSHVDVKAIAPAIVTSAPILLSPLTLRSLTLKNRVMVSPMSMYSSVDGFADDLHLVHLGRFALGGAALVMMEATAVSAVGRGTDGCNGIWLDAHIAPLRRITDFLHRCGSAAGVQLGHSGPKSSSQRPWHGGGALTQRDVQERNEQPWLTLSSSALPFDESWPRPAALSGVEIDDVVEQFRLAARRSREAGFDVIELHCAHGYLLHAFLSPLLNQRTDQYGGSLANRMRLPLRVVDAIRQEFPQDLPVFVRVSAVDGINVGWSIDDSVAFASELARRQIDAVACSSGGVKLAKGQALVSRTPGFQVPFAEQIRQQAQIPTIAVGLITEPQHAEQILQDGQADLIALGREMLFNPNWTLQAALDLQGPSAWAQWPEQFGWWLERRARSQMPRTA